jgi:hypothetical protein
MEDKISHYTLSAIWRTRNGGGVNQHKSRGLRTRRANDVVQGSQVCGVPEFQRKKMHVLAGETKISLALFVLYVNPQ